MVEIINYRVRKNAEGKPFVMLELQGDLAMVQSGQTGRWYCTAKRCLISSTFDEETAKTMIGKQLSGSIERVQTDPYEFTIPETGQIITLGFRWDYVPEGAAVVQRQASLAGV